jgi:hypothetical protein
VFVAFKASSEFAPGQAHGGAGGSDRPSCKAGPAVAHLGPIVDGLDQAELGLIDEYEFVVHPRLAGHGRCDNREALTVPGATSLCKWAAPP